INLSTGATQFAPLTAWSNFNAHSWSVLLEQQQYKQAKANGTPVKSGESATVIVHYSTIEVEDESLDEDCVEDGNTKIIPILNRHHVFNVEQLDGFEVQTRTPAHEFESIQAAEDILRRSGACYEERYSDRAFYRVSTDSIVLPLRNQFKSAESFYSVAMHELVHWTGHESRLKRDFSGKFGSKAYAFEELVAEIGSAFVCGSLGIDATNMSNHVSYIATWLEVLRRDKTAIFLAAAQAQKAFDMLIERAHVAEKADSQAA
ncbi:ArdC family protein, partial [Hydromonas duriensis]